MGLVWKASALILSCILLFLSPSASLATAFVIHRPASRHERNVVSQTGRLYAERSSHDRDTTRPFEFVVTYEGRSCQVNAYPDESILNAMERNSVMDKLCLPTMPADCRRGNCMTCAGRILHYEEDEEESNKNNNNINNININNSNVVTTVAKNSLDATNTKNDSNCNNPLVLRGDDGLAPYASDILQSSDYILLCSTFVTGDGARIALGENHAVWEELYQTRFVSDEATKTKDETVAKLLRLRAERDVPKWTAETEEVLGKTDRGDDDHF